MQRWRIHLVGLCVVSLALGIAYSVLWYLDAVSRQRMAISLVIEVALATVGLALMDAARQFRERWPWRALHAAAVASVTAGWLLVYMVLIMD